MDDSISKQDQSFSLPAGYFVTSVDLDHDEPYCMLQSPVNGGMMHRDIPKALAYYLTTHFCGSNKMMDAYKRQGRNEIRSKLKDLAEVEL